MRNGHVVYKVKNLHQAVEEWRNKGFEVEYGRSKDPINALIYFSEGAYIELLERTGIPKIAKFLSKIFGKSKKFERFFYWDECEEGWCGLCIEKDEGSLDDEVAFLKKNQIEGLLLNNLSRSDTKGRNLEYKCFFPYGTEFPFLMSYFNIDPKPKNFVHPNGVKKIKKTVFQTNERFAEILNQLVQDDTLEFVVSENESKILSVEYEI